MDALWCLRCIVGILGIEHSSSSTEISKQKQKLKVRLKVHCSICFVWKNLNSFRPIRIQNSTVHYGMHFFWRFRGFIECLRKVCYFTIHDEQCLSFIRAPFKSLVTLIRFIDSASEKAAAVPELLITCKPKIRNFPPHTLIHNSTAYNALWFTDLISLSGSETYFLYKTTAWRGSPPASKLRAVTDDEYLPVLCFTSTVILVCCTLLYFLQTPKSLAAFL